MEDADAGIVAQGAVIEAFARADLVGRAGGGREEGKKIGKGRANVGAVLVDLDKGEWQSAERDEWVIWVQGGVRCCGEDGVGFIRSSRSLQEWYSNCSK